MQSQDFEQEEGKGGRGDEKESGLERERERASERDVLRAGAAFSFCLRLFSALPFVRKEDLNYDNRER